MHTRASLHKNGDVEEDGEDCDDDDNDSDGDDDNDNDGDEYCDDDDIDDDGYDDWFATMSISQSGIDKQQNHKMKIAWCSRTFCLARRTCVRQCEV